MGDDGDSGDWGGDEGDEGSDADYGYGDYGADLGASLGIGDLGMDYGGMVGPESANTYDWAPNEWGVPQGWGPMPIDPFAGQGGGRMAQANTNWGDWDEAERRRYNESLQPGQLLYNGPYAPAMVPYLPPAALTQYGNNAPTSLNAVLARARALAAEPSTPSGYYRTMGLRMPWGRQSYDDLQRQYWQLARMLYGR